ncbi:MAG: Do family serine endopeptidase [Cyclobacteriaceae bacterium]
MSNKKFILGIMLAAFFGGIVAVAAVRWLDDEEPAYRNEQSERNIQLSKYLSDTAFTVPDGINFVYAAERVKPGVVFIRSSYSGSGGRSGLTNPLEEFYEDYFGDRERRDRRSPSRSSGSGVIVSSDGYIVTNNHVIQDADKVEVTLDDNRLYTAEVIGVDPTTDIALIKIDEKSLPYVEVGDSDNVKIGEWVLAIGNPFGTLTSTVTAGIVSAKARNINILRDRNNRQIEAFIQTDAAVNQGNSGGALVNLKGELVGINTAIATPTGSYTGYSFAVPVSLVRKVMNDLMEFGTVQRALLGVQIRNVDAILSDEYGLEIVEGVFVESVATESSAQDAGIQPGDVITNINDTKISNVAQLQEMVARNRPGDQVEVTYLRDGELNTVFVTLKNTMGDTQIVAKRKEVNFEGAVFADPPQEMLAELDIDGGAQILDLGSGKWADAGLKEGFIITSIDHMKISSAEQLEEVMQEKSGGILIEGITPDGKQNYYGYGW